MKIKKKIKKRSLFYPALVVAVVAGYAWLSSQCDMLSYLILAVVAAGVMVWSDF